MEINRSVRQQEPFFQHPATGDQFEAALRQAVSSNAHSMKELHNAIGRCMKSLRADGMECETALLTMKAFIKDRCATPGELGSPELVHSDLLMAQIVRWCIGDFYAD